jgi:hypothetical protein
MSVPQHNARETLHNAGKTSYEDGITESVFASASSPAADGTGVGLVVGEGDSPALTEDQFDALFGMALDAADSGRDRSQQTMSGIVGASDTFSCANKVLLMIRQTPWTDTPKTGQAKRGTYLHEGILRDLAASLPQLVIEQEMTAVLPSGLEVRCHPDIVDPDEDSVTDLKTTNAVDLLRRTGPKPEHIAQVNLYHLAAQREGLVTPDGIVRLIYVDSDDLDKRYVWQGEFSADVVGTADEWYRQIVEAHLNGETEAPKEWPRTKCENYCPYFTLCRGGTVNEPLAPLDSETAELVRIIAEAEKVIKPLEPVVKQAKKQLAGMAGMAGSLRLRSVWTNPSEPKLSNGRPGYWRVEIKDMGAA